MKNLPSSNPVAFFKKSVIQKERKEKKKVKNVWSTTTKHSGGYKVKDKKKKETNTQILNLWMAKN